MKRLTTEIKQFFQKECNLVTLCQKGNSKNPFYRVYTRLNTESKSFPTFPKEIRVCMLLAISGEKEWIHSVSAGNISSHSMAFHESEWNEFKKQWIEYKLNC